MSSKAQSPRSLLELPSSLAATKPLTLALSLPLACDHDGRLGRACGSSSGSWSGASPAPVVLATASAPPPPPSPLCPLRFHRPSEAAAARVAWGRLFMADERMGAAAAASRPASRANGSGSTVSEARRGRSRVRPEGEGAGRGPALARHLPHPRPKKSPITLPLFPTRSPMPLCSTWWLHNTQMMSYDLELLGSSGR